MFNPTNVTKRSEYMRLLKENILFESGEVCGEYIYVDRYRQVDCPSYLPDNPALPLQDCLLNLSDGPALLNKDAE